jgi:hypothetical protein
MVKLVNNLRDLTESIKRGAVQIILLLEGGGGGSEYFPTKILNWDMLTRSILF